MYKIDTICVFASASEKIDKKYYKVANELGVEIAKSHYNLVYGASDLGLMGEVSKTAKQLGSKVIGVMPELLYNKGIQPGDCSEFILTKGMRERKAKMDELSQALISLPGGFGTLEELSEMIVQKQLGYNNKPIVLINEHGFYDNLIKFFNNLINESFAPANSTLMYFVANNSAEAIEYINNYKIEKIDYLSEKISLK